MATASTPSAMPPPQPFSFMRLPVELRIMVYERLTITTKSYRFSRPSCLKIQLEESPSAILATCTLVRREAKPYIEGNIEAAHARMPKAMIDVDRLRLSGDFEILSHTLALLSQRLAGLRTPPASPTHLHGYSHVPIGWATEDVHKYKHWARTEMAICKVRIARQRGLTPSLPDFNIILRCERAETVPPRFSMHNVPPMWPNHSMIEYPRNTWPARVSPIPAALFLPGKYAHLKLAFLLARSRYTEGYMHQIALCKYLYHVFRQQIWFEGQTEVIRWRTVWS